jgi:hypothetical protein
VETPWINIRETYFGLVIFLPYAYSKDLRSVIEAYSLSSEIPEFYVTYHELPEILKEKCLFEKLKQTSFWDEERIMTIIAKLIAETYPINIFRLAKVLIAKIIIHQLNMQLAISRL